MVRSFQLAVVSLLLLNVSSNPLRNLSNEASHRSADYLNANHIFNAIHSSMRQFGSSLHHNGMSYFIATVPAGTHFYHGGNTSKPITGTEWLAFEPEHAMMFSTQPPIHLPEVEKHQQQVFEVADDDSHNKANRPGFLHTYSTKHDLRLLYLDGQAAAKSAIGTMDTQDYVLVNQSVGGHKGSMGEINRATQMCQRAKHQWQGRIDGILRMEGGFEIILCSFKDHLTLVRIASVFEKSPNLFTDADEFFSYYQAITARYDGIGGNRVKIDYDYFVSAYTIAEADLFRYGSKPRLNATDAAVLDDLRKQVDEMASRPSQSPLSAAHDWQSVADMIVARYAPRLAYVTSSAMSSCRVLESQLDLIMKPFIDYKARNRMAEVQRCTDEYMPSDWPSKSIAGLAIRSVSHRICSTISDVLHTSSDKTVMLPQALKRLTDLKVWLDWTTWKRCTGCKADEVCIVPMWPRGTLSDWEQPSCANKTDSFRHGGYWGPRIRE